MRVHKNSGAEPPHGLQYSVRPTLDQAKTVEPADSPITERPELSKIRIGKDPATAAIACTPIICPTKMVLIVPDRILQNTGGNQRHQENKKGFPIAFAVAPIGCVLT